MKTQITYTITWASLWCQLIWANITGNPAGQAIASLYLDLLKYTKNGEVE